MLVNIKFFFVFPLSVELLTKVNLSFIRKRRNGIIFNFVVCLNAGYGKADLCGG